MEDTTKNTLLADDRKRRLIRRWLINGMAVLGACGVFVLLGFAHRQRSETSCWALDIQVQATDGRYYLDEQTIRTILGEHAATAVGKPADAIDIAAMHMLLDANPSIRQAHVFVTVDGRCVVQVQQREPIARILNEDGSSFYLDREGYTMPLSPHYTAHVPVFTGAIREKQGADPISVLELDSAWARQSLLDDIYVFTNFLRGNEFMAAQSEHIVIDGSRNFQIIPRVGKHTIIVGEVNDLEAKYRKLMTFYASTLHARDLNLYKTINLKYRNQVVCEKY